jgi:hypothetical protein
MDIPELTRAQLSRIVFCVGMGFLLDMPTVMVAIWLLYAWPGDTDYVKDVVVSVVLFPVVVIACAMACVSFVRPEVGWHFMRILAEILSGFTPFFRLLLDSIVSTWIPLFVVFFAVRWYLRAASRGYGHFAKALGYNVE